MDAPDIRALTPGKSIRMMLYGVPGSGKTRLVGTGPKTLIIRPPTDHTDSIVQPADVKELVVSGWDDMFDVFRWLQQGGYRNHDWVWLDSISLFEDHGLDDVFADAVARKASRAEFGPDKGEYGINRGRLSKWVRDMVGLANMGHINFGLTAQPMQWWDPVKEVDVWVPLIGSAQTTLSLKLCGYMNVIAYLRVVERQDKPTQRVLMTSAAGFHGKDQLTDGKLNRMADPSMPKIISAIKKARRPRRAIRKTRGRTSK